MSIMSVMSILISILIGVPVIAMFLFPFFLFFSMPAAAAAAGGSMIILKSKAGRGVIDGGILIVDDDFGSVLPLISLLERGNKKVSFVSSGKEMIEALLKNRYEMIFLDSKMPELKGEDALVEGDQVIEISGKQPVIFISGAVAQVQVPVNLQHFEVKDIWKKGDMEDLRDNVSLLFVSA